MAEFNWIPSDSSPQTIYSSNNPFNSGWHDSRWQIWIKAAEITDLIGSNITGLTFKLDSLPSMDINLRVRIAPYTGTGLRGAWIENDLVDVAGPTVIPLSSMTITPSIDFDVPYYYSGGDLIIEISKDNNSYTGGGYIKGYYTSDPFPDYRAQGGYADNADWPFTTMTCSTTSEVPELLFTYEEAAPSERFPYGEWLSPAYTFDGYGKAMVQNIKYALKLNTSAHRARIYKALIPVTATPIADDFELVLDSSTHSPSSDFINFTELTEQISSIDDLTGYKLYIKAILETSDEFSTPQFRVNSIDLTNDTIEGIPNHEVPSPDYQINALGAGTAKVKLFMAHKNESKNLEYNITVINEPLEPLPPVYVYLQAEEKNSTELKLNFEVPEPYGEADWLIFFKVDIYTDSSKSTLLRSINSVTDYSSFKIRHNNVETTFPAQGLGRQYYGDAASLLLSIPPRKEVYVVISTGAENA